MTKEESMRHSLEDVCLMAVCYVGAANYSERESLAKWNIRKAFEDYHRGERPKWRKEKEDGQ